MTQRDLLPSHFSVKNSAKPPARDDREGWRSLTERSEVRLLTTSWPERGNSRACEIVSNEGDGIDLTRNEARFRMSNPGLADRARFNDIGLSRSISLIDRTFEPKPD